MYAIRSYYDPAFREKWRQVKLGNKARLIKYIKRKVDMDVSPDTLFDVHVKRIHEYKRQLLNIFHVITLYNRIKKDPAREIVPRTVIFGGKAAPAYIQAKLIIKLINSVANIVNSDPDVSHKLKVLFLVITSYSIHYTKLYEECRYGIVVYQQSL